MLWEEGSVRDEESEDQESEDEDAMMIASQKKSGKTCLARVMMRTTSKAFSKQGLCLLTKRLL